MGFAALFFDNHEAIACLTDEQTFGMLGLMKRAFAIIIVVLLALGMIGMFFPALVSGSL